MSDSIPSKVWVRLHWPGMRPVDVATSEEGTSEWTKSGYRVERYYVESIVLQLEAGLVRAKEALDRDATGMAVALDKIRKSIESRMWITEGRGPYEWDDDRYRDEAGVAMREVLEIAGAALNASGVLAGIEVRAAYCALSKGNCSTRRPA